MIEQYSVPKSQQSGKARLVVNVYPVLVARVLLTVTGILVFLNLTGIYLKIVRGVKSTTVNTLFAFFDFNTEANVPTFFNSLLLLFASLLLFAAAWQQRHGRAGLQNVVYWKFLGYSFLFLAIDEAVGLHEWLGLMIKVIFANGFTFSGVFYYAWIIPYALLLLAGFLFIKNFLFGLPAETRNQFILSGILFISGAIGVEMLEARHDDLMPTYESPQTLYFSSLYSLEEILEMTGVTLFIYAILKFMASSGRGIELRFGGSGKAD